MRDLGITEISEGTVMSNWPTSAKVVVILLILLIVVPTVFRLIWLAIAGVIVVGVGYLAVQAINRKR